MKTKSPIRRTGTVLVVALVCVLIVMALVGGLLQGTLRARRQLHAERDRRQTELLLDAGVNRAVLRLAAEPGYRSEAWELPAEAIVGTSPGRVTIEASREEVSQPWRLHVVAEYSLDKDLSIRRSCTLFVPSQE